MPARRPIRTSPPLREPIRIGHETDVEGWRAAARALRARGVRPNAVVFSVSDPLDPGGAARQGESDFGPRHPGSFTAPKAFLDLVERVVLHRSDERFDLLYRLLWRLAEAPGLMRVATDADVARARSLAREVVVAAQRMKAFLRFRPVRDAHGEAYVAWFEPAHRVTEAVSPFFARRFVDARFSILTPDVCVHWDRRGLVVSAGAKVADAPRVSSLETFWLAHHAWPLDPDRRGSGKPLRPARPGGGLMLPETGLMPELVARAEASGHTPSARAVRAAQRASRDAPYDGLPKL